MTSDLSPKEQTILELGMNRVLAHKTIFSHRHKQASPPFHRVMIEDWHSPNQNVLDMVFRGGAKSTIAEEAIVIKALFREFRNCLIVGANADRAIARLHAIKREFETNDIIHELFGDMRGQPWGEEKIELSTGCVIQALGKGQSLRGIKENDQRPDLVFTDDLEDRGDVSKPENRAKVRDWHDFDLVPACDPKYTERMAATPLHPESLPMSLAKSDEWVVHTFPIYYTDDNGEKVSSWPERFPIEKILQSEESATRRGQLLGWRAEYMCQAEAPETKPFKKEMFRVEPRIRTWQAVYSMTDPARTVSTKSATTGYAAWSWIGPRLVIWDAWGKRLMPNEIVNALFDTYEEFHPVHVGIEEDGLNQWLLQPIRSEMVKRGIAIPLKPMKAPRSKVDFIRSLQPFFHAREVEFAKPMPDLHDQLLGFPTGDVDAPNALAYALKMRPGAPIYDDFGPKHIIENMTPLHGSPVWLALNATHSIVTAILLQVINGKIRIYADYVREGDPLTCTDDIIGLAMLDAGAGIRCIAGPKHFDQYNNVGLRQALKRARIDLQRGSAPDQGRPYLTSMLQREKQNVPMLAVSDAAIWTLNGFSGGYARALLKQGQLADYAEEGPYRVLMEGLESFAGRLAAGESDGQDTRRNYATTADGKRYVSALPGAQAENVPLKSGW